MAKFIRVNLPVGSPENTLKLAKNISDKHTALGAGSPLTGFVDMTVFETNRGNAAALQEAGDEAQHLFESKYDQLAAVCGIGDGRTAQNKETVYWHVLQARDMLLVKYRGTEEQLEEWGFEVTISQTGGRRNIRVEIPRDNPADLVALAEAVLAKHTALGAASPLTGNIADFGAKTASASALLGEWATATALAQSKHNQALNLIGYGEGQTSHTPGTLYFDIINARNRLLQFYSGSEEQAEEFGFDVVVSSALTGKKGGSFILVQEGDLAQGMVANISTEGVDSNAVDTVTFEATGSPLRYYAAPAPGSPPGMLYLEVAAGQKVTKTKAEVDAQLGFNDVNQLLNVFNAGFAPGHYKVSIKTV